MKKIILIVIALMAMIGTAAAMPATADIAKDTFNIGGGNIDTSTVRIFDIDYPTYGSPQTRHITAVTSNADSSLQVRIYDPSDLTKDTGWISTNDPSLSAGFTYLATTPSEYTYNIEVKGTVVGSITVYDNIGTAFDYMGGCDKANVSRGANIPEFPTIALPVAAILGLAFIFQRRREED